MSQRFRFEFREDMMDDLVRGFDIKGEIVKATVLMKDEVALLLLVTEKGSYKERHLDPRELCRLYIMITDYFKTYNFVEQPPPVAFGDFLYSLFQLVVKKGIKTVLTS